MNVSQKVACVALQDSPALMIQSMSRGREGVIDCYVDNLFNRPRKRERIIR